ncbi:MAG TPA: hypothetical protein VLR90_19400 [Blastocatellia bacterium]|nr:hypothetical protein [Blastocatellia bacterium]
MKKTLITLLFLLLACQSVFAQQIQTLDDTDSLKQRRIKINSNFQILLDKLIHDVGQKENPLTFDGPLTRSGNAITCPTCLSGEINADAYQNLNAAVAAIGSTPRTLTVSSAKAVPISLTVPSTIALRMTGDGQISVASGVTLTINGPLEAPLRQIFTGAGSVKFGPNIGVAYPQWFGAKMDGATDDWAAAQKAIDAFVKIGSYQQAGVVEITGGMVINSTLTILNNAIRLRGNGWGSSINGQTRSYIKWNGSAGVPMILVNDCWGAGIENLRLIGKSSAKPSAAVEFRDSSVLHAQDIAFLTHVYIGHMYGYDTDIARQFSVGVLFSGTVNNDSNNFNDVVISGCDIAAKTDNVNASASAWDGLLITDCGVGFDASADVYLRNVNIGVSGTDFKISSAGVEMIIDGYVSEGSARFCEITAIQATLHVRGGGFQVGTAFTPADTGSERYWIKADVGGGSSNITLEDFDVTQIAGQTPTIYVGNSGGSSSSIIRLIDVTGIGINNIRLPAAFTFPNQGIFIEVIRRRTNGQLPPEITRLILDANNVENRTVDGVRNDFAGKLNLYGGPLKVWKIQKPGSPAVAATGSGATTYSYKVTALTYDGETDATAAVTCTNAASLNGTHYNTVSWNPSQGAYAYRVYGRGSGSEQLLKTVKVIELDSLEWKDDGSLTPSGALTTANTTGNVYAEGQFVAAAGSSALPPIARAADPSQGIYFDGTGIRLVANGSILATFGYGGNVSFHYAGPTIPDSGQYAWSNAGWARPSAGIIKPTDGGGGDGSIMLPKPLVTSAAAPTIASASTVAPTTSIVFISGTTTISTITAPSPLGSTGGSIILIPTGLWATNTGGNIALGTTAIVSKALLMTWDVTTSKWYPSY